VSDSTSSVATSSWQTSLASLEADALQVFRSDEEQVSQVQAKRQQARAAAASLAAAKQRLAAKKGQGRDEEKLGALQNAVEQAEAAQRSAVAEYEQALAAFHKQREKLRKERAALTRRRETLMSDLPEAVRRAYATLIASGLPDPVALIRDGHCVACRQTLSEIEGESPVLCPSCKRLIVHSVT
jgi:predicted  nucleic acid-binding Zn-ribbon protein